MTNPAPTQASSKTVSSITIPFLQVVLNLDPAFQRNKHDELFYPFGEAGHRARDFYGDPYVSGPYAPPANGGRSTPRRRHHRRKNREAGEWRARPGLGKRIATQRPDGPGATLRNRRRLIFGRLT